MSEYKNYRVEVSHPRKAGVVIDVRAKSPEGALRAFWKRAGDIKTAFGPPDKSWPVQVVREAPVTVEQLRNPTIQED